MDQQTPRPNGTNASPSVQIETAEELRSELIRLAALEKSISGLEGLPKWSKRFNKRFNISSDRELPVHKYSAAIIWLKNRSYDLEKAIARRDACRSRNHKYSVIKDIMREMHVETNESKCSEVSKTIFYKEIGQKLGLKTPFASLTELSDKDLSRVVEFVRSLTPKN